MPEGPTGVAPNAFWTLGLQQCQEVLHHCTNNEEYERPPKYTKEGYDPEMNPFKFNRSEGFARTGYVIPA